MTSYDSPGVPCRVDTFQPDPASAARFYGDLLGWTFDDPVDLPSGPYRRARLDGRVVAGIGQAPMRLSAAVWSTYVGTEDLDAAIARATAAGASVAVGPTHAPDGCLAVLVDPAGVPISLWEGPGAELVAVPGA